ncbi:hypothetical protein HMPREF0880_03336 [Yokenella regensburgei ATCC 43003]|nr:hypothetical protein HMPREF0880_03336 [Yokenella regensburgei ATCC 43003]
MSHFLFVLNQHLSGYVVNHNRAGGEVNFTLYCIEDVRSQPARQNVTAVASLREDGETIWISVNDSFCKNWGY